VQSGDECASEELSAVVSSVVKAVERDLAEIRKRDRALAESAVAASALALAREIDSPSNSAAGKAACARSLLETMERLRELAPPAGEGDRIDDLGRRREVRRASKPSRKRRSG
jgi:hypothetical protein